MLIQFGGLDKERARLIKERARLVIVSIRALLLTVFSYYLLSILAAISAESKVETLPDPNYILDYLSEGIDWELLYENPVLFLVDGKNSVLLYVWIFVMVVFLQFYVFKRAIFLWESFKTREEIQMSILNKRVEERKQSALQYKEETNIFKQFFYRIYTQPYRFKEFYEIVLKREQDSIDEFAKVLTVYYSWIIRVGIIGTLIGLMIAFYEIAQGILRHDFNSTTISSYFKNQIHNALTGNAIAVVSSLAAHVLTLVIEIFWGKYFKNQTNLTWIDEVYSKLLADGWFDDPLESSKDRLLISTNEAIEELYEFKKKVSRLSLSLDKISLQQIINNVGRITRKSSALKAEFERISPANIKKRRDQLEQMTEKFFEQYREMLISAVWIDVENLINRIKTLLGAFHSIESPSDTVIKLNSRVENLFNEFSVIKTQLISDNTIELTKITEDMKSTLAEVIKVFEMLKNTAVDCENDFAKMIQDKTTPIGEQLDFLKKKIVSVMDVLNSNDVPH